MHQAPRWFLLLAFTTLCLATPGWIFFDGQTLGGPPGSMGDDVYFENIAWHLAKNEGVKFDFTDPEWRRPYIETNLDGHNDWILALGHKGLTTSRSPGFPILVSMIYRVVGRNFAAVRIVNIVLLAASITLLLHTVARFHGMIAAALALATISLDFFVLRTAGQFMTEAPGTVIVCIVGSACIWLTQRPPASSRTALFSWTAVGAVFGMGMLIRANMNSWYLLIAAGLGVTLVWKMVNRRDWMPTFKYGLGFGVGVLLVVTPWWVRNCQVTGGFSPFGTSGSFGLVGGYCDEAYEEFGNWSLDASVASQKESMRKPGFYQLALPEQELLMGHDSEALASKWISGNWSKLPALAGMKALSHLGFYRLPLPVLWLNGLLWFGMAVGCIATRKTTGFWIVAVVLMSIITTSLTWPHYGRYSIPFRPLVHVASAIGTVMFWSYLLGRFGLRRQK